MSEINAALEISIAEEKKVAAFEQYNEAEASLKNMNRLLGFFKNKLLVIPTILSTGQKYYTLMLLGLYLCFLLSLSNCSRTSSSSGNYFSCLCSNCSTISSSSDNYFSCLYSNCSTISLFFIIIFHASIQIAQKHHRRRIIIFHHAVKGTLMDSLVTHQLLYIVKFQPRLLLWPIIYDWAFNFLIWKSNLSKILFCIFNQHVY